MKINKIKIDGFGRFVNFEMPFDESYNQIFEDNGWGKTTLCMFIKGMFYGLNKGKKDVKDEVEKYRPWNAAATRYGGAMWFSVGDKNYYLSRTFNKKKENDVCVLKNADTMMDSTDYDASKIGEQLFGIDGGSFTRTTLITRDSYDYTEAGKGVSDAINAKLGNLTEDTQDVNNYNAIMKNIKDLSNKYTLTTKNGEGMKVKNEISGLQAEVKSIPKYTNALANNSVSLNAAREEKKHIESNLKLLEEEYTQTVNATNNRNLCKQLTTLKEKLGASKEKVESILTKLPENVPTADGIDKCMEDVRNLSLLKTTYETGKLSEDETIKLTEARSILCDRSISKAEIDNAKEMIKLNKLDAIKLENIALSKQEMTRLEELGNSYKDADISLKEVNNSIDKVYTIKNKRDSIVANRDRIVTLKNQIEENKEKSKNSARKNGVIICAVGLILLMLGIVLAGVFLKNIPLLIIGVVVAISGIVTAIIGVIKFGKSKKVSDDPGLVRELESIQDSIDRDSAIIANIKKEYESIFAKLHRDIPGEISADKLRGVCSELEEYERLLCKEKVFNNSELTKAIETRSEKVIGLINEFYPGALLEEAEEKLYLLDNMRDTFEKLSAREETDKLRLVRIKESEATISEVLKEFKVTFDENTISNLDKLKTDVMSYNLLLEEYKTVSREYEEFAKANDVEKLLSFDINREYEPAELILEKKQNFTEELDKTNEKINMLEDDKADILDNLRSLEEKKDELESLKVRLAEIEEKTKLLKKLGELMTDAKNNLNTRFTAPVMKGFGEYYSVFTGGKEDYIVKADMSVEYNEYGMYRSVDNLSAGYQDMVDMSLRLGLIDAMYQDEKPVLILDDPFTNFDDTKMGNLRDFLEKINEKYQVIYFVCHSSRGVEKLN